MATEAARSTASTATPATATFAPGRVQLCTTDGDESEPRRECERRQSRRTITDTTERDAHRSKASDTNITRTQVSTRGCRCSWCARTAVWEVRLCA